MTGVGNVGTGWLPPLTSELLHDETGSTAIEYSLLASCIALAIILAVVELGEHVVGMFAGVASAFG